jgi:homocitrate synthase NifV
VRHGARLSVGMEDASRADAAFLLAVAKTAAACGARRIRYCDTVGVMEPFSLKERLETLAHSVDTEWEVHTHNDFGLATANAIAGVKAGAMYIDTTVAGLGERAGNAPLEEVVMALKVIMGIESGVAAGMLRGLAAFVSRAAARPLPDHKCIVGDRVFTHESGIHVDGVIKDPATYEPFDPALVGGQRHIVIGKHSGAKAVLHRLHELGMYPAPAAAGDIVRNVRAAASNKKGGLTDAELYEFGAGTLQ